MPLASTAAGHSRIRRTARSKSSSSASIMARTAIDSVSITSRANCRSTGSIRAMLDSRHTLTKINHTSNQGWSLVEYRVELDVYNGPLDLLLHLIKKDELDIYDIPIARITDSYMHYMAM